MFFDWQTRCLTMTEADRPGTLRLSAPMVSRERVGHSVNIRRTLSYVEGPSSFKLANKSDPVSIATTDVAPSSPSSSPSFVRIPALYAPSSAATAPWPRTASSGSRRGTFIFYHRTRRLLLRATAFLLHLSSSGSAKFIAASASPPLSSFPPLLLT